MNEHDLELLDRKAARMARARRTRGNVWRQVAHAGTLGLTLVLPTIGGAAIGRALAQAGEGRHAALVGLAIGLAIGVALVVLQVRASLRRARAEDAAEDAAEPPPTDDPGEPAP